MNSTEVYGILKKEIDTHANQNLKDFYLKILPVFCEKLNDKGLLGQSVVSKDWIRQVRNIATDAMAEDSGFVGAFIFGFVGGLFKKMESPSFSDFGLKGEILLKAQIGILTPAELFTTQPEVAFPYAK